MEAATPHLGDSQGREKGTGRLSRKANPHATPILLPGPLVRPHRESWEQWLCELGLEGVQQLFGAAIVEGQEAWGGGQERQRDP